MKYMMKKSLFLLMAAALVMGFAACSEEDEDIVGDWTPMKTNKKEIHFPIDGGCDTLRLQNYPEWWLLTVVEIVDNRRTDHYTGHNTDGTNEMEGDWFSVKVPEDAPNLLVVQCDYNFNCQSRELYIEMEFCDVFGDYHVMQDRVPRQ